MVESTWPRTSPAMERGKELGERKCVRDEKHRKHNRQRVSRPQTCRGIREDADSSNSPPLTTIIGSCHVVQPLSGSWVIRGAREMREEETTALPPTTGGYVVISAMPAAIPFGQLRLACSMAWLGSQLFSSPWEELVTLTAFAVLVAISRSLLAVWAARCAHHARCIWS